MSSNARGKKRHCKTCGAKFYDLGLDPVVCVVCEATRVAVKAAPKPAPVSVEKEAEEAKAEPVEQVKPTNEPEFISLEEVKETEAAGDDESADENADEAIAELDDTDDADIPDGDEEDTFLEQEDEEEPDMKGIIGNPIKPEEQS